MEGQGRWGGMRIALYWALLVTAGIISKSFPRAVRFLQETSPHFRRRPMSDIGQTKYAAVPHGWKKSKPELETVNK